MKLLKSFLTIISLSLLLLIFGCNSQKEYKEINNKDQQNLIAFAETAIKALPDTNITAAEKIAIIESKPILSVNYTGNKTGRYSLTWNINRKTITYIGTGDITSPETSFSKINIISVDTNSLE